LLQLNLEKINIPVPAYHRLFWNTSANHEVKVGWIAGYAAIYSSQDGHKVEDNGSESECGVGGWKGDARRVLTVTVDVPKLLALGVSY